MSQPGQNEMCDLNFVEDLGVRSTRVSQEMVRKSASPFGLEAVVVCDKYHDFLAQTLPTNKFIFDKMVVVTSAEDKETQRVCEFHHVECIRTDSLRSRWGEFCKGAAINEGLLRLSLSSWLVHLDADIYLPPQTRRLLQQAELDPAMIYGIDRYIVKGYSAWDEFSARPQLQHEAGAYIHADVFPLGTRFMQEHAQGYVPIGFFQMWNPSASGIKDYPDQHTTAGRGDTLQAMRWPRSLRAMIPEVIAYHLESDDSQMSANWFGRTTKPFAPAR